jgi:hypothetical protein
MFFKKLFLCLVLLSSFLAEDLFASPGDTTWVTVFNKRWLTQYGNYDTTANFPTGKRYRKIRLHYILATYACPGSPQYCGSWDYTTQIYTRHAGMDSVEIARVITPYASDWLGRSKTHDFIVDVTDYASSLDGNTAMRFHYSGYSWGFSLTLKIEFIEGVPPMDAIAVKNIYDGYYAYGSATNTIENYLTAKTFSYASNVGMVNIKNTISGHGSDANGCGEFCSKYYKQKLNGNVIAQKQLWRADCGNNDVSPQTGTWIYDRANWCPGAIVWPITHDISSLTASNVNFTVDADMETYTTSPVDGGFNWVSQLVQYSSPNHSLDIAIEDIVSPNIDPNYFRKNPACSTPIIRIKNVGTNTVTSVTFKYGIPNGPALTHTWTGNIKFLDTATVVFPPSTSIMNYSTSATFTIEIDKVNGVSDQNTFNNNYKSKFTPVAVFPDTIVVKFITNSSTNANTGKNETKWTLFDQNGGIVKSRNLCNNNTMHIDSLFLVPGCYKFYFEDTGCDGLYFWNNTAGGNGSCRFERANGGSPFFTFPKDFGCNYTKGFSVVAKTPLNTTQLNSINVIEDDINIYPNPISNLAYIQIDLNKAQNIQYHLMDVSGKIILEKNLYNFKGGNEIINVSNFDNGIYFFSSSFSDGKTIVKKIIIQQ